jgi:hypothetical protein
LQREENAISSGCQDELDLLPHVLGDDGQNLVQEGWSLDSVLQKQLMVGHKVEDLSQRAENRDDDGNLGTSQFAEATNGPNPFAGVATRAEVDRVDEVPIVRRGNRPARERIAQIRHQFGDVEIEAADEKVIGELGETISRTLGTEVVPETNWWAIDEFAL